MSSGIYSIIRESDVKISDIEVYYTYSPDFSTKTTTLKLSAVDIINALNLKLRSGDQIPPNASVSINIPGGGDWSNTNMEIDDHGDCPVLIKYTQETEG